jgi:hypothetical protein
MSKFNVFTELKKREKGQKHKLESNQIVNKDLDNLNAINHIIRRFEEMSSNDKMKINVNSIARRRFMHNLNLEKSKLEKKLRPSNEGFGQRLDQDELKDNLYNFRKNLPIMERNFHKNNVFINRIRILRSHITDSDNPNRDRDLADLRHYEERLIHHREEGYRLTFPTFNLDRHIRNLEQEYKTDDEQYLIAY